MTLILDQNIQGAATHALVIGVGHYRHLPNGSGPLFPDHEGMGQLTSPPHSARAFARWLLEDYHNPQRPLASLDLLLSDADSHEFQHPDGRRFPCDGATMDHVEQAVLAWKDRGDSDPDHLMLFYFCGHGIGSGLMTALLTEDFGRRADAPLKQAVDLNGLYLGMDKCAARQQCFFIDACRVASDTLIEAQGYAGDPIIYGSARASVQGKRRAPIYYATIAGARAYGRTGAPSVFTQVLLDALAGAGSDDIEEDQWRVDTDTLNRGITYLLDQQVPASERLDQVSPVDHLTSFTLHHLQGKPLVPVAVSCEPEQATAAANLSWSDGQTTVSRPEPDDSQWRLSLAAGAYRFFARFPNGGFTDGEKRSRIRPPFRPVRIEVQS